MDCSNSFFKPDKIDLAFVVFILFIMLCNVTFCSETISENVPTIRVPGMVLGEHSTIVSESGNASIRYCLLEKGYTYTLSVPSSGIVNIGFLNKVPAVGDVYTPLGTLRGEDFSFNVYNDMYFGFGWSWGANFTLTRKPITDMNGVVNILSNDVGTNQFWNIFTLAIPFILIVVIVVFGFFIIRRLTKKESKGDIRF